MVVTVGVRLGTQSRLFSFDSPSLYATELANGPTSGGNLITVKGQNFGWLDITARLRVGGTSCDSTRWFSTTALLCIVPEGNYIIKPMTVSVQFLRATLSRVFSYDKMVLEMAYIQSSNVGRGYNASHITIIGDNLGTDPRIVSSMRVRVGGSACERSSWISTTSIICKATEGVGATYRIALTSRFRVTSLSQALSFDYPALSLIHNQTNASPTASVLSVSGSGFGSVGYTQSASVGGSACLVTVWTSATSINARIALGVGQTHLISLTARIREGTLTEALSFQRPAVINAEPGNGPMIGQIFVLVSGSAFGRMDATPAVRIVSSNKFAATNSTRLRLYGTGAVSTRWISQTAVAALSARGYSTSASLIITVAEQVSSISEAFSFDRPDNIMPSPPNAPTRGRFAVIGAEGANFGWIDLCARVRVGETACEKSMWTSDSVIGCKVSAGAPTRDGQGLILTILGLKSGTCVDCFTYNLPSALRAQNPNQPTTGNTHISVIGESFGSIGDYSGKIRFGMTSSEASVWTSDSQILCTIAAGVSGLLPIIVTWDTSVSTQSNSFTYGRPQVRFISRLYSIPSGGERVTISGKHFGSADYTPVAYVDYEECLYTQWSSDSSLACGVPPGYGPGRGVAVGVAQEVGKAAIIYEYQDQHVLDAGGLPLPDHEFLKSWLSADSLDASQDSTIAVWKDRSSAGSDAQAYNSPTYHQRRVNDLPAVCFARHCIE